MGDGCFLVCRSEDDNRGSDGGSASFKGRDHSHCLRSIDLRPHWSSDLSRNTEAEMRS